MSFDLTRRRFIAAGGAAAAALPFAGSQAFSQGAWPNKPIKIIAGFPAGGQTDLFSRSYGEYVSRQVGQPVLVENKTGAGGSVAAIEVKRSPPDGYTLMITNTATIMTNRALMKDIAYDVAKDFEMISMMPSGSLPLVASEKSGAKNLQEFIAYAKKTPKVSVGTYAAGSFAHIVIAELNKQYGLNMEAVHYRGEARCGPISQVSRSMLPSAAIRRRRRCCRQVRDVPSRSHASASPCCRAWQHSRSRARPRGLSD
jgi:tripartite-type tricarboxylate transporter receptor subunit TctC